MDIISTRKKPAAHKDDFLPIQNESNEYVLNPPIEYNWFIPILHSIDSKKASTLFNELSENENISDVLQLIDYLGIQAFPLPLLHNTHLVQLNSTNDENVKKHVEYQKPNLSEARQTAAEFVIALAKNEYKLRDSITKRNVVKLVKIIFLNTNVFNSQFRHHTLTVIKKYFHSFFSFVQQRQLQQTYRIGEFRSVKTCMYISEDEAYLPDKFQKTFTWRGAYVSKEDINTNLQSESLKDVLISQTETRNSSFINTIPGYREQAGSTVELHSISDILIMTMLRLEVNYDNIPFHMYPMVQELQQEIERIMQILQELQQKIERIMQILQELQQEQEKIDQKLKESIQRLMETEPERKKIEAYSARSGYFNTVPKRPKVDKFKHRCGPKAQKYR